MPCYKCIRLLTIKRVRHVYRGLWQQNVPATPNFQLLNTAQMQNIGYNGITSMIKHCLVLSSTSYCFLFVGFHPRACIHMYKINAYITFSFQIEKCKTYTTLSQLANPYQGVKIFNWLQSYAYICQQVVKEL